MNIVTQQLTEEMFARRNEVAMLVASLTGVPVDDIMGRCRRQRIADAADSVYLVYRPERHGKEFRYPDMSQNWSNVSTEGTALLMCCKNRQGSLNGEQMLGFDCHTTRFYQQENYKPAPSSPRLEDDVPF